MRKVLFILTLFVLGTINVSFSQQKAEPVDSAYVAATSATIEVSYNIYYDGSKYYDGIAGYVFTIVNYVDTFNHVYFEGSYDGSNYVFVDSLTVLTNGNYSLYQTPPIYQKYRLSAVTATGDTATIKNITYFEKITKK